MAKNIPSYPQLFDMPFAHNGDKQAIPTTTTAAGKASWQVGFPEECSRPLEDDGIPPSRTDFNGILNLLSSWAFYAQSGGIAKWNATLNYTVPGLVYHNKVIYSCIQQNGPDTTNGAKTPGATGSEAFWQVGLGDMSTNVFGNNANKYIKNGTYWIPDAQATSNFPVAGTGGFLSVLNYGTYVHQCMILRTGQANSRTGLTSVQDANIVNRMQMYVRLSTDSGSSWQAWKRCIGENELYSGAYTQIFISTAGPTDSQGKNGDLWVRYE